MQELLREEDEAGGAEQARLVLFEHLESTQELRFFEERGDPNRKGLVSTREDQPSER